MSELNPYEAPTTVELGEDAGVGATHPELRRAATGISLVNTSITAMILAMIGGPLLAIFGGISGSGAVSVAAGVIVGLGVLGSLAALLIGQFLCVSVPAETNARTTAWISAGMQLFGMSSLFLAMLSSMLLPTGSGRSSGITSMIAEYVPAMSFIVGYVSMVVFAVFLAKLNRHMDNHQLAGSASAVVRLMIVLIGGYFLLAVLMYSARTSRIGNAQDAQQALLLIVLLGLFVLGLFTLSKYTTLLQRTSRSIKRT